MDLIRRVLRENGRRFLPRYGLAFVCMAVVSGLTGASAWILKDVVNSAFVGHDETLITGLALFVFLIYSVRGAADYFSTVVMNGIGRDITSQHRQRIYGHLLRQDMRYFNGAPLGETVMYVTQSVNSVRTVMDLIVTSLGKDLLSLLALGGVMVAMDPVLSLFALIIGPGAMFGIRSLRKRIRRIGDREHRGIAGIIAGMKETMLGIRVVKSFGMEPRMRDDMNAMIDHAAQQGYKIGNLSARSGPMMEALVGVAMAATILYASGAQRDAGALMAFLAALLLAYAPAKRLARLQLNLETALIGVSMIYRFLDRKPALADAPDAKPLIADKGEVELRNVDFSYGSGKALSNLSVRFPAGKVSALVGGSGAGKSTIFALIERFYDPQKGQVLIDEQDIRGVTTSSLRSQIAFVTQDAFLFEGSIRANIMAGRPEASEEDMIAAAKAANAHDFITAHAQGYDRKAGEGGSNLSGGQRQRIAIARAMLRDAPILLLDEATSALDAASEDKVRQALDSLMQGRTTIVIAHRLSTVRNADIIHVIDQGTLAESGTHAELLASNGVYAELSALQLSVDTGERKDKLLPAAE